MAATAQVKNDLEVYQKGTRCWFRDDQEGWIGGVLTERDVDTVLQVAKLTFKDENGGTHVAEITYGRKEGTAADTLPCLRNPPMLEGIDDLTNLSYLHEPAVLHNIRTRYAQHNIYTYSGIVLIALNPFERVAVYSHDVVQAYSGKKRGDLEPHLFAIAEDAYRCMVREGKNQTIIVSGESGAGKTVSAKYVMRYFATADDESGGNMDYMDVGGGGKREREPKSKKNIAKKASNLSLPESVAINAQLKSSVGAKGQSGISETEEQILATNPIMEAFGNAKTTRNDNSSRFGKYIEIQFDQHQTIVGAKIRTYLLERTRLVFQPQTERNYHIFYQLVAGAPPSEKKELGLGATFEHFHYLNQGNQGFINGVDDAAEFEITQRALSTIGIAVQLQWQIFRVLAALMHIGNIQISGTDRTDASISDTDEGCNHATRLLGISGSEFRRWMVKKQIITRSEKIVTAVKAPAAGVIRDAVAKYIYSNIFDWLVKIVNSSLSLASESQAVSTFIGVLDIYGFEHFKKNSFEQFCINYANEKLQQEFAEHVFKLEQELYVKEQINWTFIDFSDNTPTIEMVEGKLGILSLLDEESRLPSGSDQGYVNKLYQHFGTAQHKKIFTKPRFSNAAFTVHHYACEVTYDCEGFIEKNKDTVPDELMSVLQSSTFEFLTEILKKEEVFPPAPGPAAAPGRGGGRAVAKKPTLGSVFKASLISLMDTIHSTNVHYIRCIKPNEAKAPWGFDSQMVLNQLRACGVLETIRISCAGYPSRWSFAEFIDRYYMLVHSKQWTPDPKAFCETILQNVITIPDKYQVGLTKVFFRAGQLAYMERKRSEALNRYTVLIQKSVKRMLAQRYYRRLRKATIMAQSIMRRKIAQRTLQRIKAEKAAITIQSAWRRYSAQKEHRRQRKLIIKLQALVRGRAARKRFAKLRRESATVKIQSFYRGWRCRSAYLKYRKATVFTQSCIRRKNAKRELARKRVEARSASHLKEVSYRLENKVFELTHNLQKQENEKKELLQRIAELDAAVAEYKEKAEKHKRKAQEANEQLATVTAGIKKNLGSATTEQKAMQSKISALTEQLAEKDAEIAKLTQWMHGQNERSPSSQAPKGKPSFAAPRGVSPAARAAAAEDEATVAAIRRENEELKGHLNNLLAVAANPMATTLESPAHFQFSSSDDPDAPPRKYAVQDVPTRASGEGYVYLPENVVKDSKMHRRRHSFTDADNGGRIVSRLPMPVAGPELTASSKRNTINFSAPSGLGYAPQLAVGMVPRERSLPSVAGSPNNLPGLPPSILTDFSGDNPEARHALIKMLENEALKDEIVEMLIRTVSIPLPSLQSPMARREMLFPAHLIGLCAVQMWKYRLNDPFQSLMIGTMKTIQKQTSLKYDDDYACAFWLSNAHELLAIIRAAELEKVDASKPPTSYTRQQSDMSETDRLVNRMKSDLEFLLLEIYHGWIKDIKKRLAKMIVPGVVESQSLPGFTSSEGGFFNKLMGQGQPTITVEVFLNFYTLIWKTMTCFFVDEAVTKQIIREMLTFTAVSAFNHILMRKNFCSWKRGIQMQYNLNRIGEWCQAHQIEDTIPQFQQLTHAVKLLQMPKDSIQALDSMFDACYLLNASQIKKLLSIFAVGDYDAAVSPDIIKAAAARVSETDALLLDAKGVEEANSWKNPATRDIQTIERYIPTWLSGLVPNTNAVVAWSTRNC